MDTHQKVGLVAIYRCAALWRAVYGAREREREVSFPGTDIYVCVPVPACCISCAYRLNILAQSHFLDGRKNLISVFTLNFIVSIHVSI